MVTDTGEIYTGMWDNDQKNGNGRLILENGDYFEGNFVDNEVKGKGFYIRKRDKMLYDGEFKNNKFHGIGREEYPDGTVYNGSYQDGKKHGVGSLEFGDGSKVTGTFVDGDVNGRGKIYKRERFVYEGLFKDSFKHGRGI